MRKASDTAATDIAYHEIKSRILDLRYAAGAKLSETRLCAELGLGRSPIRTALARLKEEGWIVVTPQSGTYVKSLTAKDVAEVMDLRLLLEMHVTRIAAQQIGDSELARLRTSLSILKRRIGTAGLAGFADLDDQIHAAIYNAAGNTLITGLIQSLREKVRWVLPSAATPLVLRHALRELELIVESLEARDPDVAADRMRAHVGDGGVFYKSFHDLSVSANAMACEHRSAKKESRPTRRNAN